MSSDEQYLEDPNARDDVEGEVPESVESRRRDDPTYAPQNTGDPGYEPKAIIPALDGEGGTIFISGEDEYATMEEALQAQQDAANEGSTLDRSQDPARLEAEQRGELVEENQ
jgi:hypothetical protein